jgi:hypothetical protein
MSWGFMAIESKEKKDPLQIIVILQAYAGKYLYVGRNARS